MSIDISNRDGVINIGNGNTVISTVKSDNEAQEKALSLLAEMRKLTEKLEDVNIKGDVLDELDNLANEVVKPSDESKGKRERAMRRIGNVLEPIKHITTVSTLLVHLNTLLPIIITAIK